MSVVDEPVQLDPDKLNQFVFRAVEEVGAALNAALVVMGDKLGLYRALAGAGPLSAVELARRAGVSERYVREWLNAQAAGGFVDYDPASGRYTLPPEQTMALTDDQSPAYLPGLFQTAVGSIHRFAADHRVGADRRRGWVARAQPRRVRGVRGFFRPGYNANLTTAWLPALDGVVEKLEAGAKVADIGCGHGASTILMAQAYPNSTFDGYDYHEGSITTARERVAGGRRHGPRAVSRPRSPAKPPETATTS